MAYKRMQVNSQSLSRPTSGCPFLVLIFNLNLCVNDSLSDDSWMLVQSRLEEQLKCKLLALLAQKGSMTQEVKPSLLVYSVVAMCTNNIFDSFGCSFYFPFSMHFPFSFMSVLCRRVSVALKSSCLYAITISAEELSTSHDLRIIVELI